MKVRRKDGSENAAYVSPEFWTAYRNLGAIIVAILPPTDHDAKRGIIYRLPRKRGSKQWAVYGKGWRISSIILIKSYLDKEAFKMRSTDPDRVDPPACPVLFLEQLRLMAQLANVGAPSLVALALEMALGARDSRPASTDAPVPPHNDAAPPHRSIRGTVPPAPPAIVPKQAPVLEETEEEIIPEEKIKETAP